MVEKIYEKYNALLKGHFLLSSGKHSEYYLQSAKVLEYPNVAEELLKELAKKIDIEVDVVCSPAIGGLIAGYELARCLNVRFIFTERVKGEMTLRRGFEVKKGERVLICDDVITTGTSALEAAREIEKRKGKVVGFAAIANRSADEFKLPKDKPFFYLAKFDFKTYEPENCPLCKQGLKAIKPGSRGN